MNEEEKRAIELLENIKNDSWTTKYIMSSDSKNAEVLLNLIEKLQKENVELKKKLKIKIGDIEYMQNKINNHFVSDVEIQENFIPTQKVKDKIEEIQIEYNKLDKEVDEYINDTNKDLSKYYENKEKIGEMQTLSWCIDNLQELLVSN